MPRFLVPPQHIQGDRFRMSGSEAHHAIDVLRKKVGDPIDIFDGENASYVGRIESIEGGEVRGILLEEISARDLPVAIILYQALMKGPRWDWFLEKATEIGVRSVVPLLSARVIARPKESVWPAKMTRWRRIAVAASKQCGRARAMEVMPPASLDQALRHLPPNPAALIPWEKESDRSIDAALKDIRQKNAAMDSVHIFVGPEGGWETQEVRQAQDAHCIPVRLGPTLLRSETAGLTAATLALASLGVY